ncbi:PP2C family protein-serine/threonine phosphatase [Kitasatospora azatica]|uniref:PP2C family protein-serine/threonine phosphatase n=1 Tax=Kitasatospora azatica TaxID=58347 RepID=UPI000A061D31|nr:SpoIIE family protein phosphatase [Kitasatospora azatica]
MSGLSSVHGLDTLEGLGRLDGITGITGVPGVATFGDLSGFTDAARRPRRPATPDGDSGAQPTGLSLPGPRSNPRPTSGDRTAGPLKLLVIENDTTDTRLIEELVAASGTPVELHRAHGLAAAAALLSSTAPPGRRGRALPPVDFSCVLLDLATPSTGGPASTETDPLDGLREVLRLAPNAAVVVLTDAADAQLGAAAVATGAQDFLTRDETDGRLLARALRYAVERKRADESQRRLVEAELRGQENARLQRHLLPTPLLEGADLSFTRRYRPGRRRALLGGDFYDAVRTDDGTVHVVIGDVCGHGPDEAALGVALRIAWRTLVFAGLTGQTLLTTLQHVLEHERRSEEIFATLCMLVVAPGAPTYPSPSRHHRAATASAMAGNRTAGERPAPGVGQQPLPSDRPGVEHAQLYLAGHPAPLLLSADQRPMVLPSDLAGPALGLLPCDDADAEWPAFHVELEPGWSLLLYTDGLIEGRVGAGSRRLGQDGLVGLIGDHQARGLTRGRLVDGALAEVEELNGGALTDDVAVLLLERNQQPPLMG